MQLLILFLLTAFTAAARSLEHSNRTNELVIREEYFRWVHRMGSFKHSMYKKAQNSHEPCLKMKVKRGRPGHVGKHFTSIQAAVEAVPDFSSCRVVISIGPGIYREKVLIRSSKRYLTLEGAGADKTIIQSASHAKEMGKNGKPLSTYNTSTIGIDASYFIAKNITFKNRATASRRAGKRHHQAGVALRISGDAGAFIGCKFQGYQDTLYDHMGRHYFKDCYIEGTVDFIFGNGRSIYDRCHIHAMNLKHGCLTAQSRNSILEDTGFSFINCIVTGSGSFYLGRPWGTYSRVVFACTYMGKIIIPKGWDDWGDQSKEMTVFYGQYKCTGPGADYAGRVSWAKELTPLEAKPFISLSFIDGHEWLSLH